MDAIFRKELGCLRPADDEAERVLRGIKMGECVTVSVKRTRNIQHHRKFYALMNIILNNQEHYKSVDEIVAAFKFAIGHVDAIKTKRGVIQVPKSISFASMDQTEFEGFYDRAVDFVLAEVIPGLGRAELEAEIREMVGA